MSQARGDVILKHVCKLAAGGEDPAPDRELLRRFASRRDEAAFATLVRRHGPMVLQVCRRMLHDWHDAEDVCQAVFLVLASRAASRHWHESIANWLHQVAYHLALKAKAAAARRLARENRAPRRPPGDLLTEISGRELREVLDEELARCLRIGHSRKTLEQPARTDGFSDPLPDQAVARLGTVRLRHSGSIRAVAFSPGVRRRVGRSKTWKSWPSRLSATPWRSRLPPRCAGA